MDTDDCSETTKKRYLSKELFNGHPLKDYIVPLYNTNNLEDVIMKAKIMTRKIEDSKKGVFYAKAFPINTGSASIDTIRQVKEFAKKIKGIKETNMLEFVEYCFSLLPDENLWN